jgi:hypothetical protein
VLAYFFLGMALLAGLIVAGRWFVNADPKTLAKALKWTAGVVVVGIIVFLVATGRLGWAIMALPALLPWMARARAVHRAAKNFSRMSGGIMGGGGRTSEVRTRFLRMTLEHDSGAMNGEVIEGPHAGRPLDDLSLADLLDLLNTCHLHDVQSAQVLETYLDRVHPDWRERAQAAGAAAGNGNGAGAAAPVPGGMSREEAYQVLGLDPGASDEEIKAAHHRLIANLHPDHGGSTYLAAKINQAKDVLMGS